MDVDASLSEDVTRFVRISLAQQVKSCQPSKNTGNKLRYPLLEKMCVECCSTVDKVWHFLRFDG